MKMKSDKDELKSKLKQARCPHNMTFPIDVAKFLMSTAYMISADWVIVGFPLVHYQFQMINEHA